MSVDEDPFYHVLVDRIVTSDNEEFFDYTQFIADNADDPPSSFDGCELHEFSYRTEGGATEHRYTVVVRDGRCLLVFLTEIGLRPMN